MPVELAQGQFPALLAVRNLSWALMAVAQRITCARSGLMCSTASSLLRAPTVWKTNSVGRSGRRPAARQCQKVRTGSARGGFDTEVHPAFRGVLINLRHLVCGNSRLSRVARFSSSCATRLTPMTAEVTRGSRSVHASAICASDCRAAWRGRLARGSRPCSHRQASSGTGTPRSGPLGMRPGRRRGTCR